MCNNVSADGFLGVRVEHCRGAAIDLRHDLIGDDNGNAEFVGQSLECTHEFGQVTLSARELSAAREIRAVECRGTVDDQQREPRLGHHLCCLVEELELMIGVVGTSVGDIVQDFFAGEPIPVRHRQKSNRTKGSLCIDVQALPFAAAHVEWQLAGDSKRVAYLRLARPELTEKFGNTTRLEAARKEGVELLGAASDGDQLRTAGVHLGRSREPHRNELGGFGEDLGRFLFRDALDLFECLAWSMISSAGATLWCPRKWTVRVCDRLDGIVPAIDEQLNVALRESCNTLHRHYQRRFEGATQTWSVITSSALSGLGAPGPPTPSSYPDWDCSSSEPGVLGADAMVQPVMGGWLRRRHDRCRF